MMVGVAACDTGASRLLGSYDLKGGTGRQATIELSSGDKYRFCQATDCADGTFRISHRFSDEEGRIEFDGSELEAFARQLLADVVGSDRVESVVGKPVGSLELNYSFGVLSTELHIEPASDTAFVKR